MFACDPLLAQVVEFSSTGLKQGRHLLPDQRAKEDELFVIFERLDLVSAEGARGPPVYRAPLFLLPKSLPDLWATAGLWLACKASWSTLL